MSDLFDFFTYAFFQRALIASLAVALVCSVISFFIVLRRMAFAGSGIAHVAFGGVALALMLELPPLLGAAIFAILTALWIVAQRKQSDLSEDTAIGIAFAAAMGIGVICASIGHARNADLMTYLFGNVLTVSRLDVLALLAMAAIVLGAIALNFRKLLFVSFDEETARITGIAADRFNVLLFLLVAITVVLAIRTVGLLLVSAFLVIPGAVAQRFAKRLRPFFLLSIAVGVGSALAGLLASAAVDLPSGATMVVVAAGVFVISRLIARSKKLTQR